MASMLLWENTPGLCEEVSTLEYYPAKQKKANATVVICPGGAYSGRATHEGKGYAEFLNTLGMDAFVCQYRVSPHRFPMPLFYIRRAIRLVRAKAEVFGIDPNRIAVMGSSAGGHLAALVSTCRDPIEFENMDEIDTQRCMPNAQILCYPVIRCPDELQIAHVGSFENLLGAGKEEDYPAFPPRSPRSGPGNNRSAPCGSVVTPPEKLACLHWLAVKMCKISEDMPCGCSPQGIAFFRKEKYNNNSYVDFEVANRMLKSKWIWKKEYEGRDTYCDFYDSFAYSSGKVILQISADSNYAVYINGEFAENSQYPDYPHYKVYDELDITKFCREGKNHIAIIVWHYGRPLLTYYPGNPALRYEITCNDALVTYSDETTLCREDRQYQGGLCKLITSHLGYSFHYDITREDTWKTGELDGFESAVIVEQDLPMFPRPIKRMVWEPMVETTCILNENDTYLRYDLGREEVGYPTIKLRSSKKQKLVFAFGEHLLDGCVRKKINKYDFTVEVTVGEGENVYMNPFRRLALRYFEVFAEAPIEVDYVTVTPAYYPVKKTGMQLSDPLDRAIYDTCVRTLELCMHEHYEDGPWREQALYCLDSRNQMLCGYYCFREYEFARANLKLISQDNRYDGLLSLCFPSGNYRTPTGLCIPSFSLHYFTQVWEYMTHSGDKEFAKEIYPKLLSIMKVFTDRIDGGCVRSFSGIDHWNYYEWRGGLEGRLGQDEPEIYEAALNLLLILALRNMARISRAIGEPDQFSCLIPEIIEGIRARFLDKETGLFYNREDETRMSEFVNSLCILADVCAPEEAKKIAETLVAENTDLTPISLSTICFKYDALLKVDPEKYKDYIMAHIRHKYKIMLDQGATAFWEYDPDTITPSGSKCHGWSALPIYYYETFQSGIPTSAL